jgi:hypothetical protein
MSLFLPGSAVLPSPRAGPCAPLPCFLPVRAATLCRPPLTPPVDRTPFLSSTCRHPSRTPSPFPHYMCIRADPTSSSARRPPSPSPSSILLPATRPPLPLQRRKLHHRAPHPHFPCRRQPEPLPHAEIREESPATAPV